MSRLHTERLNAGPEEPLYLNGPGEKAFVDLPDSEMGDDADDWDAVEWLLDTVEDEHSDTERLLDSA